MFARLEAATGKRRRELFQQLVAELVRHEVAEEEILRPVSRRDAGQAIANARIKEESRAEELHKDMEKLDPGSAKFTAKLAKLRRDVERHAEAEEAKEFPRVAKKETTELVCRTALASASTCVVQCCSSWLRAQAAAARAPVRARRSSGAGGGAAPEPGAVTAACRVHGGLTGHGWSGVAGARPTSIRVCSAADAAAGCTMVDRCRCVAIPSLHG